ncbi:MAG TPA: DUF3619 family protein [Burkholderiaceae bacterium]|nr:DUF3619 family protein [Burkholderiaceae bacterium]
MNGRTTTSFREAPGLSPHPDVLEARVGRRIAARLTQSADELPNDITERLRVARQQAVDRARQLRKLSVATAWQTQGNGSAVMSGPPSWWLRLASIVPLALLLVGLFVIQRTYLEQQINAAVEIDEAILTDDLPPQAYTDPGFAEFLKSPRATE